MDELIALQDNYIQETDKEYRKSKGQFFTPRWIAVGMSRWVIDCNPTQIIDPAFGLGILLDECANQGYNGSLVGFEKDEVIAKKWLQTFELKSKVKLNIADFLELTDSVIEAAIANPPYNRFQNRDLSPRVQIKVAAMLGELANGFTNQYALFLYLVISKLSINGRAAFIVPSEFLATGYGVQVKNFLKNSGRLKHLIIFDSENRIFPEAATTACVLLFDSGISKELKVWHLSGQDEECKFIEICTSNVICQPDLTTAYLDLDPSKNWQGLGKDISESTGFVPLNGYGKVRRGIATGGNEFFLLTEKDSESLGLDAAALVPCIANAGSAKRLIFSDVDWNNLKNNDKTCYLFDGVSGQSDASKQYLAAGEQKEIHKRYLTSSRKPWYRLESREVAPLLFAVFGRNEFRVILNISNAVNLTAFHGFSPLPECGKYVNLLWLYFQTTIAKANFHAQQRAYGDGLKKLEPGDWSKLMVPDWKSWNANSLTRAMTLAQFAISSEGIVPQKYLDELELLINLNREIGSISPPVKQIVRQLSLV